MIPTIFTSAWMIYLSAANPRPSNQHIKLFCMYMHTYVRMDMWFIFVGEIILGVKKKN